MNTRRRHPREALFTGERPFPMIPSCEHFAGSEKLIKKAFDLQRNHPRTFDVTLDLEDGAPEGQERAHAEMIVDLLRSNGDRSRRRGVRVHGVHHPHWKDDVRILIGGALEDVAYLTIPKSTSAADVREASSFATALAGRTIPLHVLIETHGALSEAFAIAAVPGVETIDFGLMDFISGHHGAIDESCMRSPGQFEHAVLVRAKSLIVAAALKNGVVPSHNVTIDFKDRAQAASDAARARHAFGFLRMWSIHPDQIDPIIDAMTPSFADIARASAILLEAQKKDWAPIAYEGRLYDRASYRYHWELLERAYVAGASIDDETKKVLFS